MLRREVIYLFAVVAALSSVASADIMPVSEPTPWLTETTVSGWRIEYDNDTTVTLEGTTETTITISVEKILSALSAGQPPTNAIQFVGPVGDNAIEQIIISSESVINASGFDWSGYRWEIFPTGQTAFDWAASNWTVWPFDPVDASAWGQVSGDWAASLEVSGPPVPAGGTFSPYGALVIDVSAGPIMFNFKQIAVPEPASGMVMLLAVPAVLARRRRRKK